MFPNVYKAGFGIGGEYGEGALRIGGKTVDYYSTVAGSFGFQLGAQKKTLILVFMQKGVLNSFRESDGWKAGVDGSVARITSYNVCYTKLLRLASNLLIMFFIFKRLFFYFGKLGTLNAQVVHQTFLVKGNRITSYNVCYTKLLRLSVIDRAGLHAKLERADQG